MATFRPSTKLLFVERDKECEVTDKETTVIQAAGRDHSSFTVSACALTFLNVE